MQGNNAEMNLLVITASLGLKRGKFTETVYSPIADTRSFYLSKLLVLTAVKHTGSFKAPKAYVKNGRSQNAISKAFS